ncbi:DUF5988 family protein [Streptomyces sp. WMMC1477]|uniref:DUF5988 family protein n=1 Tax=Streptomyces sp. WMMC1477 TaxID=3015155 RepID=UPI003FCC61E5
MCGEGHGQVIVIFLTGGPDELEGVRRVRAEVLPERWTVTYCGRHQHFERSGTAAPVDFDGEQVPVFRFTHSTAIAE